MLALALVLPPAPTVTGKGRIEGHVTDQSGSPVGGAQVRIDSTSLGAVADSKGYYLISKVPEGMVDLTVAFVGYRPVRVTGLKVHAGWTVKQDFVLEQQSVDIGEIAVTAAENALTPRDAVTTAQALTGGYTPGTTLRGRRDERVTYIDGVPVQPNAPGAALAQDQSTSALEDASVTGGAASAEFGNASAGVLRGNGRDAGGERYQRIYENRFLEARTNPPPMSGTS
jgi:hypothetical protein